MVNVAVVEDDDRCAAVLTEYLRQYEREHAVRFQVRRFTDGYEIVDKYPGNLDIILMDIEMGLMDGMEAAEQIRLRDEAVEIIFATNMAQYAIRGYRVRALDYLLKPVEYIPFSESITRALNRIASREEKYLMIPSKEGAEKISSAGILWVESRGHRLSFHMKDGRTLETTVYTMKEVERELKDHGYARSSSGCLINLKEVDGFGSGDVLVGETRLAVSRGQRADFMASLARYING